MLENKQIDQVDLDIKVDPGLISISNSLKNLGSVEIKTTSSNIHSIRAKDKHAQFQVTPTKTINDLNLILQKKIATGYESIRGCCISVNGRYFFTNYNYRKNLHVISSDGTFRYGMLHIPSDGFDITVIDEKNIAITSGFSYDHIGIDIIDTETQKKIKFINLPDRPFGITRCNNSLFVCVDGLGIYKSIYTVGYSISRMISCNLPLASYVSVFNDNIYYTDKRDDCVVCCDRKGSHVWTFKATLVFKFPTGINVDNHGNVFVVGDMSSNVIIISNDGTHHREILTKDDAMNRLPFSLIKRPGNLLLPTKMQNKDMSVTGL